MVKRRRSCFQRLTLTKEQSADHTPSDGELRRTRIIKRAAMEFKNDMYGILATNVGWVYIIGIDLFHSNAMANLPSGCPPG